MKAGYVYMMASRRNGTIYIGSTSNLIQRVYQHREGLADGFTKTKIANCWSGSRLMTICKGRASANCR